jgi:uncharacterized repeat protein (TIGR03803 family)
MLTPRQAFVANAFQLSTQEEEFMKRNKSLGILGAAPLVIVTVILVVTPGAWAQSKYKTLHRFTGGTDGGSPHAGMIFDQTGNLYGTSGSGGAHGRGCVFKLTPNANGRWTENILYNFTGGKDGAYPYAGLIFDQAGNLYGTTLLGGIGNSCGGGCGVVFELGPNAKGRWKEKVLYVFTGGADGGSPFAGLIFDASGNLYGTTVDYGSYNRGGVVFRLTPNADGSWTESVLHSFTGHNDGSAPFAGLIFDVAGSLYGTTAFGGGTYDGGTVFKLTPNSGGSWTESVLYAFENEGEAPSASLIFDAAGNLYGTTSRLIGDSGFGAAFELTPDSDGTWTETLLYRFCSFDGCPDGGVPSAGLVFDRSGNLYGTTLEGGDANACGGFGLGCGVVFKLTPNSGGGWKETVVHAFFDHPGAFPYAGVIFDAAGNLYGTTAGDGGTTFGSVFEITP